MSTTANERQVGGSHYAASYQHWDLACDVGMHYLVAAATKYVTRWRKKDGMEGLQKAKHYLQKYLELVESSVVMPRGFPECGTLPASFVDSKLEKFFVANPGMSQEEVEIFSLLSHRHDASCVTTATLWLDALIDQASSQQDYVPGKRVDGLVTAKDINLFVSSLEAQNTPWAHGLACMLRSLWDMRATR